MNDFYNMNPYTVLVYFLSVLFFSMVFTHPLLVTVNVAASFIARICVCKKEIVALTKFSLPTAVIITFLNPLFRTRGRTVLFKILGRNYTVESLIYGAVLAGIFLCSINWFCCLGKILTADKLMYIFGRRFPNICIIFSTLMGLIPYFSDKLSEISDVQGNIQPEAKGSIKGYMRSFLVATDYAFEHAINMAVSMKNRGFGTGKTTRFLHYKIKIRDITVMLYSLFASVTTFFAIYKLGVDTIFIPFIQLQEISGKEIIGIVIFVCLLLAPAIMKVIRELKWKYSISKI